MKEPLKMTQIYYKCAYCGYSNCNKAEVAEHMKDCGYNPEYPEKDCPTCKYSHTIHYRRRIGHSNGYRPEIWDTKLCCDYKIMCKDGIYCCKYKSKN